MTETDAQPPTLHDLMAMVGYLLLRWGELERRLDGAKPPPGLDHIRQLRNRLCHGLVSAGAPPGEEPRLHCSVEGATVAYTWADLDAAIRELEAPGPSS
jgi:hypothetical protein